jgi:curved DNA-binding protein CbpA
VSCVNCAAFRKLSLTCHPDRNSKDPKAPERFQLITKAKEFLSDEVRMVLLADILY